jgi:hypothetical protein
MQLDIMSRTLIIERDPTRTLILEEVTGRDAVEIALLDLAFGDDEWLDEQVTTEYAEPALLLEEFDTRVVDALMSLETTRV